MKSPGMVVLPLLLAALAVAEDPAAETSPLEKVTNLLTELKDRITGDAENEQKIYDKYACWCEESTQRKAKAITAARDQLRALGQSILKLKGRAAILSAEINKLKVDIQANEEAQATATSIRQKENAAYQAESNEIMQALGALEKAVTVLKGAAGSALLQHSAKVSEVRHHIDAVIAALPAGGSTAVAPSKLALLRKAASALESGSKTKYAPQSATIQGILSDMYSTFGDDLQSQTESEATSNRNFEDFIATKQEELKTMQESLQKKIAEKAEAEVMLAEAMQAYDDTDKQMKADIEFFDLTKEGCMEKSSEWKERKELRKSELEGIEKALEILTSDESKELFGKAIKPGMEKAFFLQVGMMSDNGAPVRKAYEVLKTQATKLKSIRLAKLAATVAMGKVGHFDKVLEAIDAMVKTLKTEQVQDTEKRDQCKDENHMIDRQLGDLDWKIEVNEAEIAKLQAQIEAKEKELEDTIKAIEEVIVQIQEMKDERKAENEAFLQAKKDDEDAIKVMTEAKDVMAKYYKEHAKLFLVQQGPDFKVSEDQAPDATFSDKAKNKNESQGIVSLMKMIIEDLEGEIRAGIANEESAQLAFEKALAAAEQLKADLEEKKVNLEGVIAHKKEKKLEEKEIKVTNEENRTDTKKYQTEIKPECDWIVDNYVQRREQRTMEMDGLAQAKDFLAGYQPPSEAALVTEHAVVQKAIPQKVVPQKVAAQTAAPVKNDIAVDAKRPSLRAHAA